MLRRVKPERVEAGQFTVAECWLAIVYLSRFHKLMLVNADGGTSLSFRFVFGELLIQRSRLFEMHYLAS